MNTGSKNMTADYGLSLKYTLKPGPKRHQKNYLKSVAASRLVLNPIRISSDPVRWRSGK